MTIHDDLYEVGACHEARKWALDKEPKEIWDTCTRSEWMIWWINAVRPFNYERDLRLIAADIAETIISFYEEKYPNDNRPRNAIIAARNYAYGFITDTKFATDWYDNQSDSYKMLFSNQNIASYTAIITAKSIMPANAASGACFSAETILGPNSSINNCDIIRKYYPEMPMYRRN